MRPVKLKVVLTKEGINKRVINKGSKNPNTTPEAQKLLGTNCNIRTLGSFWNVKAKKNGKGCIFTREKKYHKLKGKIPILSAQQTNTPTRPTPEEQKKRKQSNKPMEERLWSKK